MTTLSGQEQDQYLLGDEQKLYIIVYILGEVDKPGEYRVPDNTDVVELIAKAGGETEFSNLGSVTISRQVTAEANSQEELKRSSDREILKFDAKKYLKKEGSSSAPVLKPGDVVYVNRNKWHKWRNVATVIRDISVVVSAYLLYLRVVD